jgi:predicted permease
LLTLALGIGVATAMYAVVEAVLLRPLPYESADRLAMLWSADPARGIREQPTSYLTFADWKARTRSFSDLAIFQGEPAVVTGPNGTERVLAELVSANLFPLLGVAPSLGRTFSSEEELRNDPVVVISHGFWTRQFAGAPEAIGATITLRTGRVDVKEYRIVGVMPPTFYFPNKDVQLWRATLSGFGSGAAAKWKTEPRYRFIVNDWGVVGRLGPDATVDAARSEMAGIGEDLARVHGAQSSKATSFPGFGIEVVPLIDQLTGNTLERALWLLFAAVGIVLLITCVNVAGLLYARGAVRTREFAIRSALGAGRVRLVRQLLTESIVLAGVAGAAGLLVAGLGIRLVSLYAPPGVYPTPSSSYELTDSVRAPIRSAHPGVPRLDELRVDRRIATFAAGVSLLAVFVFGLTPARRATLTAPQGVLKREGRSLSGDRSLVRTRHMLVAFECALAVLLLVAAGLLIRTLANLDDVHPGFIADRVLLMRVSVAPISATAQTNPVDNMERRRVFYEEVRSRLHQEPGVERIGLITDFFVRPMSSERVNVPGSDGVDRSDFGWSAVDAGFFETIGVPLLRGRGFTGLDVVTTIRVGRMSSVERARTGAATPAVVNQLFAQRHLPGEAVGRRFGIGPDDKVSWYEVVGVVGNMQRNGLDRPPVAEYFTPYIGQTSQLVIRTNGDPAAAASRLSDVVRSVDPNGIVMGSTPLERKIAELDATRGLQARLLTLFAGLALLLAAIGIYGTVSYAVTWRTHELGIRIALGARPLNVMTMVLRQGMAAPFVGLSAGLAVTPLATNLLAHVLFETSPTDPKTLSIVGATLVLAALVACILPARRAARVDPIVSLRHE